VRAARKISFFQPYIVKHLLHEGDVLRLPTVGRAGYGELFVAPAERVESARREKGEYLKWLGARAPVGERVTVASGAEELISFSDYRCVYSMFRFNSVATGNGNVQLVRLDHAE
jgi:hypothetical protein